LRETDNTQPLLLQHGSKIIAERNCIWYREKETSDQSPTRTDDEDKHFQQSEFQDIHSHDDLTLESAASYSQIQDKSNISELEQDLVNGLNKLKILDVNVLSEKIQRTEERIEDCRENDRKEETEKETQILSQLKHMTLLDEEITKLKSTQLVEGSSNVMELSRLEHELVNGLELLKILDENVLSEKIQQTKERIKDYQENDRKEETEKETQILAQLEQLTLLDEEITKLKSTQLVEDRNNVIKPRRLEQDLTEDISVCDASGIEETASPEVDIANDVGVIEALKAKLNRAFTSKDGLGK
ncbi:unnamed protein product, partial [Didymodactylos carnosus]